MSAVERSADARQSSRDAVVEVAARLLAESGASAVTTRRVAVAAGVPAPTIYRLFGDKDGLLDAVAEHVLARYVAEKVADVETSRAAAADPVDDLHAGWHTHVEFGLANPALFRLMNTAGRADPSPAVAAGYAVLRARVHRVALAGRLRIGEDRATALLHAAGTGLVLDLLTDAPEQRDAGLPEMMWQAVAQAIFRNTAPDVDDAVPAAAVVLRAAAAELAVLSEAERTLMAEWLDRLISER